MKKIAIIIVFIFSLNKMYSQKYRPVDSTTAWATEYVYKIDGTCYVQQKGKFYIKGYTLNNSNKWLKIYSSQTSNWHPNSPQATCMNLSFNMPGPSYNNFGGYLLNDSLNKRVYFKGNLPANYTPVAADILYDFNNKIVGDTLYVPSFQTLKFKITAIDSVLFTGKYHKRFIGKTSASLNPQQEYSFTEGIGSSIHPFYPIINGMGEQYSNLLCFASPTQSIAVTNHTLFANGSCTSFLMSSLEKNKDEFSIFPNPVSNKLSIINMQFVSERTEYELIDLVGHQKLKGQLKEGDNNIDLQTLSDGIYFINFYKEGNIVSSKKIVISKD